MYGCMKSSRITSGVALGFFVFCFCVDVFLYSCLFKLVPPSQGWRSESALLFRALEAAALSGMTDLLVVVLGVEFGGVGGWGMGGIHKGVRHEAWQWNERRVKAVAPLAIQVTDESLGRSVVRMQGRGEIADPERYWCGGGRPPRSQA